MLLQRYAMYFDLLRLDLVAMWMFVLSASVVLFGLRPVIRFAWVWALLLMVFPLPYYLIVILLGGSKVAAGVGTMVIAGVATGIAVGTQHASRVDRVGRRLGGGRCHPRGDGPASSPMRPCSPIR